MFNKICFVFQLLLYCLFSIVLPIMIVKECRYQCRKSRCKSERRINMIISIIGITLYILMDIYFLIPESIKYYRDIPQLISGEYDSTKGCIETHIRRTGKNLYDISIVNGIPLKGTVSYKDEKNYKCYKFYYLSNTKWIIKYY